MGGVTNTLKPVTTAAGMTQAKTSYSKVASGNLYDVAIIGGGPAGMTAAIYCARKKLKTLMLTKDLGGQAAWSSDVENYLGFSMVSGADLTKHFQDHVQEFSDDITLKFVTQGVVSLEKIGGEFQIKTGDGAENMARAIIVSSGKQPKKLGIDGEDEFLNKGVTYCAWCDGPLFRGKSVAIIGGGNAALDAALSVQKLAKEITLVNIGEELTGDEVMIEKAIAAANIRVLNNTQALAISGDKLVRQLSLRDSGTGLDKELPVDGVFIEIGSVPATDFLQGVVELNPDGEIIIDNQNMTSQAGIFAAGDATDVLEKQIIVAAGEGAKAAIQCSKWLSAQPR
jgi:alkyl hydroperoxide reductase subunit F